MDGFNNGGEESQSNQIAHLPYQKVEPNKFFIDEMTYLHKQFLIRLDLRTLAGPILGYKLVMLLR